MCFMYVYLYGRDAYLYVSARQNTYMCYMSKFKITVYRAVQMLCTYFLESSLFLKWVINNYFFPAANFNTKFYIIAYILSLTICSFFHRDVMLCGWKCYEL